MNCTNSTLIERQSNTSWWPFFNRKIVVGELTDADRHNEEPDKRHEGEVQPMADILCHVSHNTTHKVGEGQMLWHAWVVD